jgi:hypothetical protein
MSIGGPRANEGGTLVLFGSIIAEQAFYVKGDTLKLAKKDVLDLTGLRDLSSLDTPQRLSTYERSPLCSDGQRSNEKYPIFDAAAAWCYNGNGRELSLGNLPYAADSCRDAAAAAPPQTVSIACSVSNSAGVFCEST